MTTRTCRCCRYRLRSPSVDTARRGKDRMTAAALAPAGFAVLVALMYYRRFRRLFGRQPVQPARMKFRIVFLFIVGAVLLARAVLGLEAGLAIAAGLGAGI